MVYSPTLDDFYGKLVGKYTRILWVQAYSSPEGGPTDSCSFASPKTGLPWIKKVSYRPKISVEAHLMSLTNQQYHPLKIDGWKI